MKGPDKMVEGRVVDTTRTFEESIIDYRFARVWFQNAGNASRITVKPLRRHIRQKRPCCPTTRIRSIQRHGYRIISLMPPM